MHEVRASGLQYDWLSQNLSAPPSTTPLCMYPIVSSVVDAVGRRGRPWARASVGRCVERRGASRGRWSGIGRRVGMGAGNGVSWKNQIQKSRVHLIQNRTRLTTAAGVYRSVHRGALYVMGGDQWGGCSAQIGATQETSHESSTICACGACPSVPPKQSRGGRAHATV